MTVADPATWSVAELAAHLEATARVAPAIIDKLKANHISGYADLAIMTSTIESALLVLPFFIVLAKC